MITCLLVDGESQALQQLSQTLGRLGLRCRRAASAAEALTMCRMLAPSLVVVGETFAAYDAPDFIKRVRLTGRGRPPVVFIHTAKPNSLTIGRLIADGAAECLVAPADEDIVIFKLRQAGLLRDPLSKCA